MMMTRRARPRHTVQCLLHTSRSKYNYRSRYIYITTLYYYTKLQTKDRIFLLVSYSASCSRFCDDVMKFNGGYTMMCEKTRRLLLLILKKSYGKLKHITRERYVLLRDSVWVRNTNTLSTTLTMTQPKYNITEPKSSTPLIRFGATRSTFFQIENCFCWNLTTH